MREELKVVTVMVMAIPLTFMVPLVVIGDRYALTVMVPSVVLAVKTVAGVCFCYISNGSVRESFERKRSPITFTRIGLFVETFQLSKGNQRLLSFIL